MTGRGERDLVRADRAARGLDALDRAAGAAHEPRDLGVLDDVDPEVGGGARVGPRDLVVARDPTPALQRRAHDRIPDVGGDVHDRAEGPDLLGRQPFGVDAVEPVRLDASDARADVAEVVREVEDAALRELEIGAQVLLEPLPELQRVLVDRGRLVPEVVRADDRGVARHVAAGEPALLDDAHVGDAVVLRQVVGGREAVAAAPHDDDVVRRLGLSGAPVPVVVHASGRPAGGGTVSRRSSLAVNAGRRARATRPSPAAPGSRRRPSRPARTRAAGWRSPTVRPWRSPGLRASPRSRSRAR